MSAVIDLEIPQIVWKETRKLRALLLWSAAFVSLAVLLGAAVIAWPEQETWAPLRPFGVQQVTSRVDGMPDPAARMDDGVAVTAKKCSNEKVLVHGSVWWQSVSPPGTFVLGGSSASVQERGCVITKYVNAVPPDVRLAVQHGLTQWVITGTETPSKTDGSGEGVPGVWRTEVFRLVQ